ncbi:MAG: relaxase/mobilization nuclease domain-containing protein, partial [Oscillospiraceae bacterium]|nr:relaxase/mobilization nuclease domain-containing protein [Oscillospiraceae bacterium]
MPFVKSKPIRATVERSLTYILNPEKTDGLVLTSSLNCLVDPDGAYFNMKMVYERFSGKSFDEPIPKSGKGRVKAIHYIQSFDPKDKISPELAHRIAKAFTLKVFGKDSQVVIATHVDKEHIHTHFIVNTYGVDGHKFNDNKETLKKIREESDRVCLAFGIKPIESKLGVSQ